MKTAAPLFSNKYILSHDLRCTQKCIFELLSTQLLIDLSKFHDAHYFCALLYLTSIMKGSHIFIFLTKKAKYFNIQFYSKAYAVNKPKKKKPFENN